LKPGAEICCEIRKITDDKNGGCGVQYKQEEGRCVVWNVFEGSYLTATAGLGLSSLFWDAWQSAL
jgi:CO dehydrogenase/acetyl-CoA synthase alpha subunit